MTAAEKFAKLDAELAGQIAAIDQLLLDLKRDYQPGDKIDASIAIALAQSGRNLMVDLRRERQVVLDGLLGLRQEMAQ